MALVQTVVLVCAGDQLLSRAESPRCLVVCRTLAGVQMMQQIMAWRHQLHLHLWLASLQQSQYQPKLHRPQQEQAALQPCRRRS